MNTHELLQQVGAFALLTTLLLAMAVLVLRLLALPLAMASLGLDRLATLAARPLTLPVPTGVTWEAPPR